MSADETPIRVLLAITRLELGGAQRVVLHTARALDRKSFAVALAWGPGDRLDDEAAAIPDLARYPVPTLVRPVAPVSDILALGSLRAAMRAFRPDVVHTHSSKAGVLGRLSARLERISTVHTVHGYGFTPLQSAAKRLTFRTVEKIMARATDHFVTVSETDRRRGIEMGLFKPERASVIRAAIDLERFYNSDGGDEVRADLGVPAGVPLVTQIGNFKPQKAPLDFVRSAAAVRARVADAWFVMVGDGPLRLAAETLAHDLGVADRMIFCGWWDDIPGLLDATTVSVLTSRHEGLPCAVVESLAAGVPVVATAVDGTAEVVRSESNGLLVPPGDVGAIADAVCRLLEDDALRARMAAAARLWLGDFDNDLMVRKQEELYRWMCSHRRS